jgi:hypothetical protein
MQLQFLPKQLMQWRVLCLFEKFSNSKLLKLPGLHLAYKFSDQLTFFPLDGATDTLNCMKVSYFYHQEQRPPGPFLKTFVAEIRVTQGTDWSRWVGKTSMSLLKDFPDDMPPRTALAQSAHTVLFDHSQEPVLHLSLKAGVSADHLVNSKNIKSMMAKQSDIYIPDPHYCTTDPLPTAWMELFDYLQEDASIDEEVERDIYVPTLSRAELLRMEDITSPLRKKSIRLTSQHGKPPTHDSYGSPHKSSMKALSGCLSEELSAIPRLDLGEMLETSGNEVKKLHSSVSQFLYRRPTTANVRPTSANVVKQVSMRSLKRDTTNRTGASSTTMRSSRSGNSSSTMLSANKRQQIFERQMWLINQYSGIAP